MNQGSMSTVFSATLLVVTALALTVLCNPVCYNLESGGSVCSNITPDRVYLDHDLLFVGSKNYLHKFDAKDGITFKQSIELLSDNATRIACDYDRDLCENYIRIVQPIPTTAVEALAGKLEVAERRRLDNTILVCGTNSFNPKCTVHKRNNISDWYFLTNTTDVGFSPYSPNQQNLGILISNGRFFTATEFDPVLSELKVAVAPNGLLGNTKFIAGTADRDDLYLGLGAEFVSLYEIGEYIFVFARERAIEAGNNIIYSRVYRICKTDTGITEDEVIPRFLTFQKVRLLCLKKGENSQSFDFSYNEIASTYLHWPEEGVDPVLYATFRSVSNGPVGTAICKFGFDSINTLFESAQYLIRVGGEFVTESSSPFLCPNSQRTAEDATRYQLIDGSALPIDRDTLHTENGEMYTKIAVDVFSYNTILNEAMFVGTNSGQLKLVLREINGSTVVTTEFTISSTPSGKSVTHLLLEKNDTTGIRKFVISTSDSLADITLGNCAKYTSCVECLESRDLYCAWQEEHQSCVNKLLETGTPNTTEAIKAPANVAMVCGPVISSMVVHVQPTHTVQESTIIDIFIQTSTVFVACTTSSMIPMITSTPSVGVVQTVGQPSIGKLVGALIGGLVLGLIVGGIVCCIGLALKRSVLGKSTNSSPSHSPTVLSSNVIHNNHTSQERGVVQYSISAVLPEKPPATQSCEKYSPPSPPSTSPPMLDIDSELDDDVISDLSPTRITNQRPTAHGRTLSTRPLMESCSEPDP